MADLGVERVGTGGRALDREVAALAVEDAKGLEFDGVVLIEPAALVADGPRGLNDLYVAMTRPTQQLHVVHTGVLPPGMEKLTEQSDVRPAAPARRPARHRRNASRPARRRWWPRRRRR